MYVCCILVVFWQQFCRIRWYSGCILLIHWYYFSSILAVFWQCFGNMLVVFWRYLVIFWQYFSDMFVFWQYFGIFLVVFWSIWSYLVLFCVFLRIIMGHQPSTEFSCAVRYLNQIIVLIQSSVCFVYFQCIQYTFEQNYEGHQQSTNTSLVGR